MAVWWKISLAVGCSLLSGVFAGLTLGLMSLDLIDLRVLADSGTDKEKWYATKIIPVRKRGNFLLCTLLVGNTAVNVASSIITADIFGGILGFVTSTIVILYIGEIIPQAICHRFGLVVGAYAIPFIKLVMVLTAIISYPTSKVLDYFLGGEPPTRYNKSQLKSLLSIHGSHPPQDPTSAADFAEKGLQHPVDSQYVIQSTMSNGDVAAAKTTLPGGQDPYHVWTSSDKHQDMLIKSASGSVMESDCRTEIVTNETDISEKVSDKRFFMFRKKNSGVQENTQRNRGSLLSRMRSRGSYEKSTSIGDRLEADGTFARSEERDSEKDRSKKDCDSPQKPLTHSEITILGGAFDFSHKTVVEVMTQLESVFMLDASMSLDFDALLVIFQSGHSRIPVYEGKKTNIIGVLFAKDLILLDPEDCVPIKTVLLVFGRTLLAVMDSTPLDAMLNIFKTGGGHLALVQKVANKGMQDESYETVGVCTLEDLIEELIGQDIVDETDVFTDNIHRKRVRRDRRIDLDVLKMLDGKQHEERLSEKEIKVVAAYLGSNFEAFDPSIISPDVLLDFLAEVPIVECLQLPTGDDTCDGLRLVGMKDTLHDYNSGPSGHCDEDIDVTPRSYQHGETVQRRDERFDDSVGIAQDDQLPSSDALILEAIDRSHTLLAPKRTDGVSSGDKVSTAKEITIYQRNIPTQDAYLIINGKLEITAGHEGFVSSAGPWTLLSVKALTDDLYAPDFTARIVEAPARLLRIRRRLYRRMVKYSNGTDNPTGRHSNSSRNHSGLENGGRRDNAHRGSATLDTGKRGQAQLTVTVRKQMRDRNLQWSELATEKAFDSTAWDLSGDAEVPAIEQPKTSDADNATAKPWKSLDEGDLSVSARPPPPGS